MDFVHTLKTHGVLAFWVPGGIRVRDVWCKDGRVSRRWLTIPATHKAVYDFLGY